MSKQYVITIGYDHYVLDDTENEFQLHNLLSMRLRKVRYSADYKSMHFADEDDARLVSEVHLREITPDPALEGEF